MSRDGYVVDSRSPRGVRLPTVDQSPSRAYVGTSPVPLQRKSGYRTTTSPDHGPIYSTYHNQYSGGGGYRDDELSPTMLDGTVSDRRHLITATGSGHHRSRSASRPPNHMSVRYQSLDRGPVDHLVADREFMPIRDRRDRSLDRALYYEDELYAGGGTTTRPVRQSPPPSQHQQHQQQQQPFIGELQHQNSDLMRELGTLKKELELTNQKLGSSMHSIKTFWSPELKKERALRKEESAKYSLINDQLKLLSSENQKQAMLVRQLEEELRLRMRGPSIEMQQQMEAIYQENEHLTREIAILRDTIKELELRIETQKQTLQARDESIKKLLEMLQNKGMCKEEERQMFQQMQAMAQKQLDEFRMEIQRRDQEILAMGAKMKTLEEQHQDYQRHIAVLKESLCAKEEHYNMLQTDLDEYKTRLEEKNRHIEKRTQIQQQDRARVNGEVAELREHMDIKDRKINVLQRKVENLEDLLKEKDNQVDMARARLSAMQAHQCTSEGALSSLEEAIGDKEKQLLQLRDQRDRAEQEKREERDLHERELADYRLKIHTLNSEVEKFSARLERVQNDRDRLESKLESSQSELGKSKAELDRAVTDVGRLGDLEQARQRISRLELENDRLRQENERNTYKLTTTGSVYGSTRDMVESRQHERSNSSDRSGADLRRCQAELRVTQADSERARGEVIALQEKLEKSQGEVYRLKARLENSHQEQDNLREELEKAQASTSKLHADKDRAYNELDKSREEMERTQGMFVKLQNQHEKLQDSLDKAQNDCDKLQEKVDKCVGENRRLQLERDKLSYDSENFQTQLDKTLAQCARLQKEKETVEEDVDRLRDKCESTQVAILRLQKEKEVYHNDYDTIKEKTEQQTNHIMKLQRERADLDHEFNAMKERLDKLNLQQQKLQISRDDALKENMSLKEKLDKVMYTTQKVQEDRDNLQKDFDKLLEKYERGQNDIHRLQSKLETVQADAERYAIDGEKHQLLTTKLKDDVRKMQEELQHTQELYDRVAAQLARSKEVEEKSKEEVQRYSVDLEMISERYEKAQLDVRRYQGERDKFQTDMERMHYELERAQNQSAKTQMSFEKSQNEVARLQIDVEKSQEKFDKLQNEFRKVVGELDILREATSSSGGGGGSSTGRLSRYDRDSSARSQEENQRLRAEVDRLRERLDKTLTDLDRTRKDLAASEGMRGKFTFEQEKERNADLEKIRDELQISLTNNQQLENKLHELTMELDLARHELCKVSEGHDKQRRDLEKAIMECEKYRERYDKLKMQMGKDSEKLRMEIAQTERRQTLNADKVRNDERIEVEKLKEKLDKAIQARDATELEAGRLAQELEKSQKHLAKALETNEATKIEFERMATELARMHERIEHDKLQWTTLEHERDVLKAELQQTRTTGNRRTMDDQTVTKLQQELAQVTRDRDQMITILEQQGRQGDSIQKQIMKYESDIKQLGMEREQLVAQLEKSQDMLMSFQQEINQSQTEIDRYKTEIQRLRNSNNIQEPQKTSRKLPDPEQQKVINVLNEEIHRLQQQLATAVKEQESLQNQHGQTNGELEQWRKVIEQESQRADMAEKTARELQNRILQFEKASTTINTANGDKDKEIKRLKAELEQTHGEVRNLCTERDRLQKQLEILVEELEQKQIELQQIQQRSVPNPKQSEEMLMQKRQIDEDKKQVEERKRAVDVKQRQVEEKERLLAETEKQLKKRQEQLSQLEATLNRAGGSAEATVAELNRKLSESQKVLESTQEQVEKSTAEVERLLNLVQMSQEEQNMKEKQIMDLQQALRNAQGQLKNQQQVNAQLEEQRKKDEAGPASFLKSFF